MFETILALFARIVSNPLANLIQKKLSATESSLTINFYASVAMAFLCIPFLGILTEIVYSIKLIILIISAGSLCFLGTICLIKALSIGEMSVLGPVNSYKSVIGLVFAFFILGETPSIKALMGFLCILGASILFVDEKGRFLFNKSVALRFLALLFTGVEAVILKKIIIITNPLATLIFWCLTGVVFSFISCAAAGKIKYKNTSTVSSCAIIGILLFIMQLSTNYVFKKFDVGLALSLFQLSSIVSLIIGFKFFKEKGVLKKTTGTIIMIIGSALILIK